MKKYMYGKEATWLQILSDEADPVDRIGSLETIEMKVGVLITTLAAILEHLPVDAQRGIIASEFYGIDYES